MKVIVIKSNVAYAMGLASDVSPAINDIIVALQEGIMSIEAVGDLVDVRNGIPSIKNWEDMKGVKLGRKAMVYNTIYVKKLFVEEKQDRADWSACIAGWLKKARNKLATIGESSPHLKTLALKQEQGWTQIESFIPCANCSKPIYGIRSIKKTQSVFTPNMPATKGTGINCRKWYCGCTKDAVEVPEHLQKVVDVSVKDELDKLRLDYSAAMSSIKTLENMVSDLTDKLEDPNLVTNKIRDIFVRNFMGMNTDAYLSFKTVLTYLKDDSEL